MALKDKSLSATAAKTNVFSNRF